MMNRLRTWWAQRRAFEANLREELAEEAHQAGRAKLAARVIGGLIPEKDRRVLRMRDAYTWRRGGLVHVHLVSSVLRAALEASEAFEHLRWRLVREGYKVELERAYNRYGKTLTLELTVEGLPGLPRVSVTLRGLSLGPDCVIEEREVEELVEHQPEVEEHYETKTQHVAICTDPVSGERKEVVIE